MSKANKVHVLTVTMGRPVLRKMAMQEVIAQFTQQILDKKLVVYQRGTAVEYSFTK